MNKTTKLLLALSSLSLCSTVAEEITTSGEFKKVDTNGDKLIDRAELEERFPNPDSVQRIFDKHDKNSDGKLTEKEAGISLVWPDHKAIFAYFDKDSDKNLSFDEFKGFGGKKTTKGWYDMMDYDKNGKMSMGEFKKVIEDCQ